MWKRRIGKGSKSVDEKKWKVFELLFKSVREWKIEGCFKKFVENAMGDCNRKKWRGWPPSWVLYVSVNISMKREMGMEKKSVG